MKKEKTMQKKAEALLKAAPLPLREKDEIELNRLFPAYVFRSGNEIWTTCCNRRKVLNVKDCTDAEWYVLHERHVPEPEIHWGAVSNRAEAERRVCCPYCGAEAKLKEIRYSGRRKNLRAYRRAVVLRQWRGALWALAFDLSKSYERKLQPEVGKNLLGVYRFRPGRCEGIVKYWYHDGLPNRYAEMTEFNYSKPNPLTAPYGYTNDYGKDYEIVGLDEIKRSEFRYCEIEALQKSNDLIKLLSLCCFAARKVEMLQKAGMGWAVGDLLNDHMQNAKILNWRAKTPKDFLKVKLPLLKELGMTDRIRMHLWQRVGRPSVSELDAAEKLAALGCGDSVLRSSKRLGIQFGKLMEYLQRGRKKTTNLGNAAQIWKDYIDAAEHIGLDLTNPLVLLPKDLNRKHDEACTAWTAMQDVKKTEAYKKRYKTLTEKYTFSYGGLTVCVPEGGESIKNEGKSLHHCVGGYAERHLNGATTILFLRRDANVPMVTIEMGGNTLRQIHGWDDERTACAENPNRERCETLYADFLTVWLAWIKAGSRRDKQGEPILPRKYQQQEAKTA